MDLGPICSGQRRNTNHCTAACLSLRKHSSGRGWGVLLVHYHCPLDTAAMMMVMLSHGGGFLSKLRQVKHREGGKITPQNPLGNTDPHSCFWPEPDSYPSVS